MRAIHSFLCLATALVLNVPQTGHAEITPGETVRDTIATVMTILNDPMYREPGMSDARRVALENVVRRSVNYREMARRTLGVTWMVLSETDRQRFSDLFLQVLRDAVASRMNVYTETTVEYVGEQREGNFAEVHTLFRGYKNDTAVDVRLVNQSGQWLMYDAVIDDVRLVDNYRSQFVHVIKEAAYAGLVGRLEAMILLPKTFERTVAR